VIVRLANAMASGRVRINLAVCGGERTYLRKYRKLLNFDFRWCFVVSGVFLGMSGSSAKCVWSVNTREHFDRRKLERVKVTPRDDLQCR